jgi:hypothetical protein
MENPTTRMKQDIVLQHKVVTIGNEINVGNAHNYQKIVGTTHPTKC